MTGRPILYVFCLVEKNKILIPNSRYEVISGLAAFFGMEISEAYAHTCYADMKYRSKKSYSDFIDKLRDVFLAKIERDIEKSGK